MEINRSRCRALCRRNSFVCYKFAPFPETQTVLFWRNFWSLRAHRKFTLTSCFAKWLQNKLKLQDSATLSVADWITCQSPAFKTMSSGAFYSCRLHHFLSLEVVFLLLFSASRLLYSLCIFFNKRPSSLAPRVFGHTGWIMQKLLCRILPA